MSGNITIWRYQRGNQKP